MANNVEVTQGEGTTFKTTDNAGVHTGHVNVDALPALPAGDNNIGNVDIASAIPAGDNNIGNVDIASAIPAGSNTIGGVNLAQYTPSSGRLPVDGSGVTQPVSDAGGSLTIDNAALGATSDAVADAGGEGSISAKLRRVTTQLATLAAAVSTEMQVDVVGALPAGDNNIGNVDVVTLPALPAGNNNIGDVDIASIAAGDNNIGNVDIASALPAGTNNIGDVDVLSVSGGVAANAADTATPVKVGARYDSTTPTYDNGDVTNLQADARGSLHVALRQPGADAAISGGDLANDGLSTGTIGITARALGYMYNGSSVDRIRGDTTNGLLASPPGVSVFRSLDLDETEEDVKTSAGKLYKLRITNFATAPVYVKLYNDTAANVTVGTTTPIDTIVVPAASASDACVLTENFGGRGLIFSTALSLAAVTGLADSSTGAPATNACVVSAYYD